jgi:hypothetical protein
MKMIQAKQTTALRIPSPSFVVMTAFLILIAETVPVRTVGVNTLFAQQKKGPGQQTTPGPATTKTIVEVRVYAMPDVLTWAKTETMNSPATLMFRYYTNQPGAVTASWRVLDKPSTSEMAVALPPPKVIASGTLGKVPNPGLVSTFEIDFRPIVPSSPPESAITYWVYVATQDPQGKPIGVESAPVRIRYVKYSGKPTEFGPVPGVLTYNAVALDMNGAEPTVVAFGPGEHPACPNGRLLFASRDRVLATDLKGAKEGLPHNPWSPTYNSVPRPPLLIYDNHIVKLKNGDVLFTVEGIAWEDNVNPHPAWWNSFTEYPLAKNYKYYSDPGCRTIIFVFRSSDCGNTWTHDPAIVKDIDAATLSVPNSNGQNPQVGLVGRPRHHVGDGSNYVPIGKKWCNAGGFDGHFLYADPYSGYVYVATVATYGGDSDYKTETSIGLLLVSKDNGKSWTVLGRRDGLAQGDFFRPPIAALPSGRVAVAFSANSTAAPVSAYLSVFNSSDTWVNLGNATKIMR